jgi:hypothetical protein
MTRKLISKKELKTVYGIPYCLAHIARLREVPQEATTRSLPGGVVRR